MKTIMLIICLAGRSCLLPAQGFHSFPGIIASTAYSGDHAEAFGFIQNTAASARAPETTAGMGAASPYLIEGLQQQVFALFVPSRYGTFGLMGQRYVVNDFSENTLMLSYARILSPSVETALALGMEKKSIRGYSGSTSPMISLSMRAMLKEGLYMGFQWLNPRLPWVAAGKNQLMQTSSIQTGLGWAPSEHHFISLSAIKNFPGSVQINASLHYAFARSFFARLGFSGSSQQLETGIGYQIRKYRLIVTGSYHPSLGITPGIWFSTGFKSKN